MKDCLVCAPVLRTECVVKPVRQKQQLSLPQAARLDPISCASLQALSTSVDPETYHTTCTEVTTYTQVQHTPRYWATSIECSATKQPANVHAQSYL